MLDAIFQKYIPVNSNDTTNYLKVELYYRLGGMNYYTYKIEPRGYYLSVIPVCKKANTETYSAFSGCKCCIKECTRKSKKAQADAESQVKLYLDTMIEKVCNENGLEILKG